MPTVKPPAGAIPASPEDTELQFYEALQHGDIEHLMSVWAEDDDIACVHPGGGRIVGAPAIRASFEAIFANGAVDVHPEKVRRLQTDTTAIHSVLERVQVMTDEGPRSAWVVATNVYLKTAVGWRLAAHHASPGTPHEAQDIVETATVLH